MKSRPFISGKILNMVIAGLIAISMTLGISIPTFAAQKILIAHFEPEQAPWPQVMKEFGKELEEITNGKVKATYAFGGSMGGPGEYHDLVARGMVDVSIAVLAFGGPGRFPMIDVIALPYYIPQGEISAKAMLYFWQKGYLDKELSEVKPIGFAGGQGDTLFTKNKPVTSLADMKGLKIFASTPLVAEKVKLWGGDSRRYSHDRFIHGPPEEYH